MKNLFAKQWFLAVLLLVLAVGIGFAPSLEWLTSQRALRDSVVALVLFVMALPLEIRAMGRALLRPGPPLLACAINLGLLPLFAWAVSQTLSREMGLGLLVAATTPSTLASAAVWTRRAGGNDAIAILVTIITNTLCFVVTPLWMVVLTGQSVDNPDLSLTKMASKLGLLVVLPMVVAQLLRMHDGIARAATARKSRLSTLAQCGILTMVLFGAVGSGIRLREMPLEAMLVWDLSTMVVAVLVVHLTMFWVAVGLASALGYAREDQIAVGFSGSQKTLMVGLLVAISLGITILPMVCYHILQLVVDTVIADRYRANHPGPT